MTEEMKMELFKKALTEEHLINKSIYGDNEEHFHKSNAMYECFVVLGIEKEYINWSKGKTCKHRYVAFKGDVYDIVEY